MEAWEIVQRQHHAPIAGPVEAAAEVEREEAVQAVEERNDGPEEGGMAAEV